jgi:hypothetical protein
MPRARVALDLDGTVAGAEALWFDTGRWVAWVDGFARILRQEGEWPQPGAVVEWESRPGGRGRVLERSLRHESGSGQTVEVDDEQLRATQEVSFRALEDGVEVALELVYELKEAGPLRRLTDVLFIRRAIADSLRRTLVRFGRELATAPQ